MKEDWVVTTLNDICVRITDGSHWSPKGIIEGIPMASVKDMTDFGLNIETSKRISDEDYQKLVKNDCKPQIDDVLIAKDGSYLKHVFVWKKHIDIAILSSIAILRPNKKIIEPEFLAKYLMSPVTKKVMSGYVTGSALPRIILKDFKKFQILLPPLTTQRKIAGILSAYDDLIENNTRRIQILEEMAQRICREWFVNFRYPSHEKQKLIESELGMIPEGWEVGKFEQNYHIYNGFAFKSKDYSDKGTLIIRTKDFSSSGYIDISEEIRLPDNLLEQYKKFFLQELDFLVIMVGASIGKYGIVFKKDLPSLQNQNMWAIRPKPNSRLSRYYAILMMPNQINKVLNFATGAARSFFRKEFFYERYIIVPPKHILEEFDNMADSIIREIGVLIEKIQNLRQTRDLLLPKLISGKIDVSELEIGESR